MEITAHWTCILRTTKDGKFYGGEFHCSHCGTKTLNKYNYPDNEYYCHYCGAHMIETPVMEIEEYKGDEYTWE